LGGQTELKKSRRDGCAKSIANSNKAIALQNLTSEGKILAIEHSETPESIYANPQLFPSMLPWLFPYGLGGIGQTEHKYKLSNMTHKRYLLMYYDK
jgi:hypothetical protein